MAKEKSRSYNNNKSSDNRKNNHNYKYTDMATSKEYTVSINITIISSILVYSLVANMPGGSPEQKIYFSLSLDFRYVMIIVIASRLTDYSTRESFLVYLVNRQYRSNQMFVFVRLLRAALECSQYIGTKTLRVNMRKGRMKVCRVECDLRGIWITNK